jgi:D-alanyl-D-alanine carboxypeptidase (penicillin-binding protein 5/6)
VGTSWKVGNQITVEDALYLVIYESDTYACWLLAEHIAGSEEAFVQLMNQKATALGLQDTHFENNTGLYHDNHYTTCLDMATIMAAAMKNAAAKTVLMSKDQYFVDIYANGIKQGSFSMWSGWYTGRLEKYRYGSAAAKYAGNGSDIELIAGKTGYETVPKNCFVTAGQNDVTGTLFVCVQVGAGSAKISTDDTREIYQQFATY